MKIVITRNGIFKQKWSFKLVGNNGKILAWSEKYYNFQDMLDTIKLIQFEIMDCEVENKYLNMKL